MAKKGKETKMTVLDIKPGDQVDPKDPIKVCDRCGLRYDWHKSTSTMLKMTYCGSLCERLGLGFTLDAVMTMQRVVKVKSATSRTEVAPALLASI